VRKNEGEVLGGLPLMLPSPGGATYQRWNDEGGQTLQSDPRRGTFSDDESRCECIASARMPLMEVTLAGTAPNREGRIGRADVCGNPGLSLGVARAVSRKRGQRSSKRRAAKELDAPF
jgi:hypothetical protein